MGIYSSKEFLLKGPQILFNTFLKFWDLSVWFDLVQVQTKHGGFQINLPHIKPPFHSKNHSWIQLIQPRWYRYLSKWNLPPEQHHTEKFIQINLRREVNVISDLLLSNDTQSLEVTILIYEAPTLLGSLYPCQALPGHTTRRGHATSRFVGDFYKL